MSFSAAASLVVRRHRYLGGAFSSSFSSLCSNTDRPSPPPSPSPWLMLSSPTNPEFRYLYGLAEDEEEIIKLKHKAKIHLPDIADHICIGSSHGFIVSINACSSPDTIHALNPLTGTHLPLPSPSLLPNPNPNCLQHRCKHWKSPPEWVSFDSRFLLMFDGKALLSSTLDTLTLLLLRPGSPAFARVGFGVGAEEEHSWTCLRPYSMDDAIFHNDGRIYTVDFFGDVRVFDLDAPSAAPQTLPLTGPLGNEQSPLRRSLVAAPGAGAGGGGEDDDDLFLVFRDAVWQELPTRTRWVKVFKLERKKRRRNNEIQYKWTQVKSIGDLALFVGSTSSFALSAKDFPGGGVRPNTVYFTDNFPCDYLLNPDRVGDTGYFSLEDGTVHFFHLTEDGDSDHRLNWPPPVWYMPTLCC